MSFIKITKFYPISKSLENILNSLIEIVFEYPKKRGDVLDNTM